MPEENHYNIGFYKSNEDKAIACIFLIKDYPCTNILWLGLFLVHNNYHRQNIGTTIINSLIHFLKKSNFHSIRLPVKDNNSSGFNFWTKLGFVIIEKTLCGNFYNLTMELKLENQMQ